MAGDEFDWSEAYHACVDAPQPCVVGNRIDGKDYCIECVPAEGDDFGPQPIYNEGGYTCISCGKRLRDAE